MKKAKYPFGSFCALLLLLTVASASFSGIPGEFAIVYTTDAHGHIATDEETIGLDVIAAIKKGIPGAILLDAGDFLHGTPIATLTQGRDVVELMKRAGYAATAVGNHEFDYGWRVLAERAGEAGSPPKVVKMLAANVSRRDRALCFEPWTILDVNGLKVGIFGVTTLDTEYQSSPSAVEGVSFANPMETAERVSKVLRKMGCDLVVALTHIETGESLEMARQVDGIDIIVGGHSHVVVDEVLNGTAVISSGCHGKNVGIFEVRRDEDGVYRTTNRILSKADTVSIEPDAFLAMRIGMIRDEQARLLSQVVGYTEVDLDGERERVRTRETNLGNLAADALMAATGADVAIMNGGTIRATIPRGEITQGQILTTFPYSNIAMSKVVTGAQLRDILEVAFGRLPIDDGRFPQVAGFRVTVDRAREPGSRVRKIELLSGAPFEEGSKYSLGVNDFLAEGGDDYPHLKDLPIERQTMSLEEAFLSYVAKHGTAAYASTQPGRIVYER